MKNVHEIEIELNNQEWKKVLDDVLSKKIKETKLDGFRKGQVPKDVYLKKFGYESIFMDAVDAALPLAYSKLLDEKKLIPVVEPKIDIKTINENSVIFIFKLITKPDVKIGEYKNLKIKKENVDVSEEEINAEIEAIRTKMADIVIKENAPVASGNTVVVNFHGFVDGKELEGGKGENYPLEIGSNTFIPGFEEGLIGMLPGEEKELKLKFPQDYVEDLKGKEVIFNVKVIEIKEKVLPEINADLFTDLGYEEVKTAEDFKERVKADLLKQKEAEEEDKYIDKVINKAIDNMAVEINEEIINEEIDRMLKQYEQQLQYQGINLQQYYEFTKTTAEDLRAKMKDESIKRIKTRYLLEEVAVKENITVSDDEANEEADKLAIMYQTTKEEFIKMMGGIEIVKYDTQMRRALDLLRK